MLEILIKGRWMMVPLLACSILVLSVFIDRARAFWTNRRVDSRSLRSRILALLEAGQLSEAASLCAQTPGPVSAVILTGLKSYAKHKRIIRRAESVTNVMEKAMEDYSQHALSAVEKRLGVLSTIGAAAPLLGMTGTVLGMINSFEKLAGAGGLDPSVVAVGISEALITTASGLLIGLAAVIPYSFFSSMSDKLALEIDEAQTELIDFVATRLENEPEREGG